MTPASSSERLNAMAKRLGDVVRYLEVGVAKGSTFFAVEASDKHGVDPRFRFDPASRCSHRNEHYHPISSDAFFDQALGSKESFDLIFLDGLHTFSQTLRDFLSSQAIAHSRTVWLIDDTVPSSAVAADPNLDRVQAARRLAGNPDNQTWMGDVFKVIAFIDNFCPQYTCLTTEGHGQTVVLPLPRIEENKRFPSVKDIDQLDYVDLLLLQDTLFSPKPFEQILDLIDQLPKHKAVLQ